MRTYREMGLEERVEIQLRLEAGDTLRCIARSLNRRQEVYRQIAGLSAQPQDIDLVRPTEWMADTAARERDGREAKLPTREHHALCNEDGLYPAELDQWEIAVLKSEMQRKGFQCWYRNPDRPSQDSLGIAYEDDGQYKIVRPDFLFFAEDDSGKIAVDIVDPHGTHLSDALPKLRGLARYAEAHGGHYRRIGAIAGRLRVLDLTREEVRAAVAAASSAASLYGGVLASNYS